MEAIAEVLNALPSLGGADTERILAWVAALFAVLAIIGWSLDAVLPRLRAHAESTDTDVDNKVVGWLERVHAVLGLINAMVPRPKLGERNPEPAEDENPPSDKGDDLGLGGGAALLFAVVVGASVLVQGCGASQWDVHAVAADTSNQTAQTGRAMILAERRRVLMAAGQGAEDIAAAVRAAAERWDLTNSAIVDAYNLFVTTANQYAQSAFAALRGEADDLSELQVLAGRVADAWNTVASLIEGETDFSLPRIPEWLLRFLQGDPTAQPALGGVS